MVAHSLLNGCRESKESNMKCRLVRVLIRVPEIEGAAAFYEQVLGVSGRRVSPGRHHLALGDIEVVCYDPAADGDLHDTAQSPSLWQLYVAADEIESVLNRVECAMGHVEQPISTKPWGERSFYACDPFGNRLCFIEASSLRSR
jgi:predicted enzyme related to lactoylglutathione lyase